MRYGSVCSGIEAVSVAWRGLGWRPSFLSEIEAFPLAVLKHHWREAPLHGDFTTIKEGEYDPIDILVGGTPCQDFSVAGLRAGMAGDRGNLTLQFLTLARRLRPKWLVWENVPGVLSSNDGRDFGAFLGGLGELGYGWAYRTLDAQYFGVPQRRRRVFVIGCFGDWRRAAAVLFERHSLQGHPTPRRETGEGIAPTISLRPTGGGGLGTDFDCDGGLIAPPLTSNPYGDHESREGLLQVTHALRADGFDASEDGTGRGTPIISFQTRGSNIDTGDVPGTIGSNADRASGSAPMIAFAIQERATCENPEAGPDGAGWRGDGAAYTLEARTVPQAVALRDREGGATAELSDVPSALRASGDKAHVLAFQPKASSTQSMNPGEISPSIGTTKEVGAFIGSAVRRLTPRECERLQGFPDDYTLVPFRGKPAADGPRYKALGNSMAVPVMRWLGERVALVHGLSQ